MLMFKNRFKGLINGEMYFFTWPIICFGCLKFLAITVYGHPPKIKKNLAVLFHENEHKAMYRCCRCINFYLQNENVCIIITKKGGKSKKSFYSPLFSHHHYLRSSQIRKCSLQERINLSIYCTTTLSLPPKLFSD
jgi:hypothetical protein